MRHSAWLAGRSLPRLRRCRMVLPDDAAHNGAHIPAHAYEFYGEAWSLEDEHANDC